MNVKIKFKKLQLANLYQKMSLLLKLIITKILIFKKNKIIKKMIKNLNNKWKFKLTYNKMIFLIIIIIKLKKVIKIKTMICFSIIKKNFKKVQLLLKDYKMIIMNQSK